MGYRGSSAMTTGFGLCFLACSIYKSTSRSADKESYSNQSEMDSITSLSCAPMNLVDPKDGYFF